MPFQNMIPFQNEKEENGVLENVFYKKQISEVWAL